MDYSYILIEKALKTLHFLSQSKKHSTSKITRKPCIFNEFEKQVGAVNRGVKEVHSYIIPTLLLHRIPTLDILL